MLEKIIAVIIILLFLLYIYRKVNKIRKGNLEDNPCAGCSRDCNLKK